MDHYHQYAIPLLIFISPIDHSGSDEEDDIVVLELGDAGHLRDQALLQHQKIKELKSSQLPKKKDK